MKEQDLTWVNERILIEIKLHNSIFTEFSIKDTETIYLSLINKDISNDENFALDLRIEYLKELFSLFNDKEHHSRSMKILELIEDLSKIYENDINIGEIYIEWLLSLNINMVVLKDMNIQKYIQKVNEKIQIYKFK